MATHHGWQSFVPLGSSGPFQQAGSKVFLLPDDPEYEKRSDAYRRKMAEGKSKNLMKQDGE